MDIIDKIYNNTWRTVYEEIHENHFKEFTLFTYDFIEQRKSIQISIEGCLYSQVTMNTYIA